MVFGDTHSQRLGSNRRGTDGTRVDYFPSSLHWQFSLRYKRCGIKVWSRSISRKDHLDVNVQWHRENCIAHSGHVAAYAKKFPQGYWSFWDLVARRSGAEAMSANQTESGTAESMMLNFAESGILYFVPPVFWTRFKKQRWMKWVLALQRKWRNRWTDSSHWFFCQSGQYPWSSPRFVQRTGPRLKKTNRWWGLGIYGSTDRISQW